MAQLQSQAPEQAHHSSHIFLSFSGNDRKRAAQVREGLRAQGLNVWWDEDIQGGEDWVEQLQSRLDDCSAYLILYGRHGHTRWVRAELHYALRLHFERDLPLFPLRLPGVTPEQLPPFLSIFQAPELDDPADFAALARTLKQGIEQTITAPAYNPNVCPFPGLRAFQRDEARFFFGRQTEVAEALQLLGIGTRDLQHRRWLLIEGPSGVGKSSLVWAGLLPAIEQGWLYSGGRMEQWHIAQMRPGAEPLENLAHALYQVRPQGVVTDIGQLLERLSAPGERGERALRHLLKEWLPPGQGLLLVIDQLEELFTLTQERAQRERLDQLIDQALADEGGPLYLVTTIRSDFMLQFTDLPQLHQRINGNIGRYYLKPMGRDGLKDIVTTPAYLAGLRWSEPSLPERIVQDAVAAGRAALPLLGNLLWLLWRERSDDGVLSARVFDEELRGVGGALRTSTQALLEKIAAQDEKEGVERVRRLFIALINDGRGGRDTRRIISLASAIEVVGGSHWRWIIDQLSGLPAPGESEQTSHPRLILVDTQEALPGRPPTDPKVEIAHEALLENDSEGTPYWPQLASWLKAHRAEMEQRDLLESLTQVWDKADRPRFSHLLGARQIRAFKPIAASAKPPAALFLRQSRQALWTVRSGIGALLLLLAMAGDYVGNFVGSELWKTHPKPGMALFREHLQARWQGPIAPKLVKIEAGSFLMGSPEGEGDETERPQHPVTLPSPFWLASHELTFAEWDPYVLATGARWPGDVGWGRERQPVIHVSWDDAQGYLRWLSQATGVACRLPSEAEWEYAARAGSQSRYHFGDDADALDEYAWYDKNSDSQPHVVGAKAPNHWGLHDMHGNVWEWTQDAYHGSYQGAPNDGSAWEGEPGDRRVLRGGSWSSNAEGARAAFRGWGSPVLRDYSVGFRVLCVSPIHTDH